MNYDIGIIGGGPGGYTAAIKAAQAGAAVVLFEAEAAGGTCLNKGCIPTKSLLKSAHLFSEILKAEQFGITVTDVSADLEQIMVRKEQIVATLSAGVESLLKKNGVKLIRAWAEIKEPGLIAAAGREYQVQDIIIASGSVPAMPPIKGIAYAKDSDAMLSLSVLPESLAIIGGGVIGVEFAEIFAQLGARVTLIEMLPQLLSAADEMVSQKAQQQLQRLGVAIYTDARVSEITPGSVILEGKDDREVIEAELVFVAAGRRANIDEAALNALNIKTDRGAVITDEMQQTSIAGIYAIGDVNGKSMLAHTAAMEAEIAVRNIIGEKAIMEYDKIPSCVYTAPEIAWVGMTEQEARQMGIPVRVGEFPMHANGRSVVEGAGDGIIKLIARADTREILGGHLVCSHATEMIMEVVLLMGMEGMAEDIKRSVHPHPTISEAIAEAAAMLDGQAVHI